MKIKRGDTVKVLSGKDRGQRAKVLKVFPSENLVLVDGVNLKKKHQRPKRADRKGEIILIPAPISASAVQIICSSCGKPTRVGHRIDDEEKKQRICKKCGKVL